MGNTSSSIVQRAFTTLAIVLCIAFAQVSIAEPVDITADPFVRAVRQESAKPDGLTESSSLEYLRLMPVDSEEDAMRILDQLSAARGDREMQLVLAGVSSQMSRVRIASVRQLLDARVRTKVRTLSHELIPVLEDFATEEESAELLGLLELPETLKADVLKSETVPDRVKARLGDIAAEARVISRFRSAPPFNRMVYAERDLLYIDSRESLSALVEELNSRDVFVDRFGNQVSITQMMIQAYGRAHPEVSLFQPAAYLPHCYTSEEDFRAPEHQAFLRTVGKYFSDLLGRPIKVDAPFLIMGSERIEKY